MKLFFSTFLLLSASLCFAQNSFRATTYGSFDQMIQLDNGNYVAVGTYSQDLAGIYNSLTVTLFTPKGQQISNITLGQFSPQDFGYSIVKTNDYGYAITGKYRSNLILVKFDSAGNIQWQKTYNYFVNSADQLNGAKLIQLKNSGYCIAGGVRNGFGKNGGILLQTDSAGNLIFLKKYFNYQSGIFDDVSASFIDAAETSDGIICLARTAYYNSDYLQNDTSWLVKLNKSGKVLWSKFLYRDSFSTNKYYTSSITVSPDETSYVLAGSMTKTHYNSPTDSNSISHLFITKTDTAGNIIWSKTNDTIPGDTFALTRIQNSGIDDGYICAGSLSTKNVVADTTYNAVLLMKIDKNGNVQWTRTIGERIFEYILFGSIRVYASLYVNNFISTNDKGFLVSANYNNSAPHANFSPEWLLFKFDSLQQICTDTHSYGSLINTNAGSAIGKVNVVDLSNFSGVISDSLPFYSSGYINVSCSGNYVLPVQLLSFTALQQNNSQVDLEWKTSNEINAAYYVIQRSNSAIIFKDLLQINAHSNSDNLNTYNITDKNPLSGTSYYRLKQVDKDGKVTYSSIASVTLTSNGTVVISPNPVQSLVNVRMQSAAADKINLQITDLTGKVLFLKQQAIAQGSNTIILSAASLHSGIYILKVARSNGKTEMLKFVKE